MPRLEERIEQYSRRIGHAPQSWAELIRAGVLPGVPLDPLGHPYKLADGGRVQVAVPDDFPFITKGLPPGVQAAEKPKL